ncbi:MAG: AMP-binding protein, partial [Gemmatimonadaceae bacterium]
MAVEDLPDGVLTYAELDALSDRVRDRLRQLGVQRGDRVGICLRKTIDAYAAMLGAMKAGASYVPVDLSAPAWRTAFILSDCAVRVVVIDAEVAPAWRAEAGRLGEVPTVLELTGPGGGRALHQRLSGLDAEAPAAGGQNEALGADDLAYILYTSGSTGKPKGVMLSHRNAVAYVEWCSTVFTPTSSDRFSSHAPFHFDLSILDLYVPLKHGAAVVLIDAEQGKEPLGLAQLMAERRLTVWYSTPTILTLLAQAGRMERHDYRALRLALFAGEVFPPKHLRAIKEQLPRAAFYNLYGPTETNVCTYHPIPDEVDAERTTPYPIGRVCEHLEARVTDLDGHDVPVGEEGELVIRGDNVMQGYWNLPERSAA